MSDRIGSAAVVPGMPPQWVFKFFNPVARFLLTAGVPMGLNGLITIRGRKSALPRTTPVAIIEVSGRRWVWAPWSDVQWVRNLRAARPRHQSPCTAGKRKYVGPSWTRHSESGSFATFLVLSREAYRSVSGSFASSMGSISTVRESGRGSACLRASPTSMKAAADAGIGPRADSLTPPKLATSVAASLVNSGVV